MEDTLSKNYIVEKSKSLIWAKFSKYNLNELRLIDTYLSKINARDGDTSEVVFGIDEYLKLMGYSEPEKVTSGRIKKILSKFMNAQIEIPLNNKDDYKLVTLFSDVCVMNSNPDFDKRTITIDCNPKLKEAFFDLAAKGYVEYELDYSLRLSSKYSLRLYPLLKDNLYKKEWNVELKELRELLGATNKNNENFREFNKVLQKCMVEINKITDIKFKYEKITHGRLTRGIIFKIKKKKMENNKQIISDESFPENSSINNEMERRYNFWSEACDGEFSQAQMEELVVLAREHVTAPEQSEKYEVEIYHYLERKYKALNAKDQSEIKNRYGYLKWLVENENRQEKEKTNKKEAVKKNRFNNFPQRTYDYEELERMLLTTTID